MNHSPNTEEFRTQIIAQALEDFGASMEKRGGMTLEQFVGLTMLAHEVTPLTDSELNQLRLMNLEGTDTERQEQIVSACEEYDPYAGLAMGVDLGNFVSATVEELGSRKLSRAEKSAVGPLRHRNKMRSVAALAIRRTRMHHLTGARKV